MEIFVLIPAYKAQDFLGDCIESILAQKGVEVQILIGVDGCAHTLTAAKQYASDRVKVYYFPENKGTYITFNSLLELTPDNVLVQCFGADDIMLPGMLQAMLINMPCYSKFSGISLIHKKYYDTLGGFRPWRVAADTEFKDRMLKICPEFKRVPQMYRIRQHPGQLTKGKNTGFRSVMRGQCVQFIEEQRRNGIKELQITRYIHGDYIEHI